MRQLRIDFHSIVASGRDWPLFVQCLRPLPQDEQRHSTATYQTDASLGNNNFLDIQKKIFNLMIR